MVWGCLGGVPKFGESSGKEHGPSNGNWGYIGNYIRDV